MRTVFSILLSVFGWFASHAVASDHQDSHKQEAHVHGVGRLNVVFEDNQLQLELFTPAMNIVGFEHEPTNAEQEKLVKDALAVLQDVDQVFDWPAEAGCKAIEVEVETAMMEDEHHEHDAAGHDEHEDHDEHHEGHEEHDEEVHSEFHATYVVQCKKPESMRFLDVNLFQPFPGTEEIQAQVVGPQGQTALELTSESARIAF